MRQPTFYSAVFGVIRDSQGKILFQKRQNTGFRDGMYQLPSGHLEGTETMKEALIRELREELDIVMGEEDLKIVHIAHTVGADRVYFNIYMDVVGYVGTVKNLEAHKCESIGFYDLHTIQEDELFTYETETLLRIQAGEMFSEKVVSY